MVIVVLEWKKKFFLSKSWRSEHYYINSHPLTININLFKQININQTFDKIQMILIMKTSISNNRISWLKKTVRKNQFKWTTRAN